MTYTFDHPGNTGDLLTWSDSYHGGTMVNLQPTTYCTAMWNGARCTGKHGIEWVSDDGSYEVIHSDDCTRSWREGWGGITADMPYELDRSALDTLTYYPNWRYSTGAYRLGRDEI